MHMLRSDTVDRRCPQGCARWYRDCHGVDLGGGVASCCLGHPCMLEVCLRVPMYWSIESILVGRLLTLPSTIVIHEGFIDPRSRYAQPLLSRIELNSRIPSILATRTTERHRHLKEADGTNRVAYACSDRCTAHSATGLTGRRLCCSDRLFCLPL